MSEIDEICKNAKEASYELAGLSTDKKNKVLLACANALSDNMDGIMAANAVDMENGRMKNMKESLLDRLCLTEDRIEGMADGLRQIAMLDDPIGEVISMKRRPNGLLIGQRRVPLGVIGVIYEARPNVTSDVFGLCFKTSNVVILKGGSDAITSNKAIVDIFHDVLHHMNLPENFVSLIEDTSHESTAEFMTEDEYVDLLIPRGGKGLISTVTKNSTIPVIETGTGNCHVYVDKYANFDMALDIIENAKTQRTGVCNAMESLVVHKDIKDEFLPLLEKRLAPKKVKYHADADSISAFAEGDAVPATEEDFGTEYLDLIMSVKTVSSLDEAIRHINKYNTGHSEVIVTDNYENAMEFLDRIDAAAVYVNASSRFTDGGEFGFGAEIGISTQKLHARGPMGLLALTSYKYVIFGNGQIR